MIFRACVWASLRCQKVPPLPLLQGSEDDRAIVLIACWATKCECLLRVVAIRTGEPG
jgi:hypothetical protein